VGVFLILKAQSGFTGSRGDSGKVSCDSLPAVAVNVQVSYCQ